MESNEHQEDGLNAKDLLRYFVWTAVVIAGVMVLYFLVVKWAYGGTLANMASFGDSFGPINAFVSGVTFFVLIISIILQRNDLKAQTKALMLQQTALEQQITEFQHQKDEMARAASAQEEANRITRLGFQVEALKSRIAWHTAFIQRGGALGNADNRVKEHVEELETLLRQNGIEIGPRDH